MANSTTFQFRYSYQREINDVMLKVSIGASGAPTINQGKGVVSVVRNSTGRYTITLKDVFNSLLNCPVQTISPSGPAAAPLSCVISETVSSTKTVVIQMSDAAGVAADPASGDTLMVNIILRNAST